MKTFGRWFVGQEATRMLRQSAFPSLLILLCVLVQPSFSQDVSLPAGEILYYEAFSRNQGKGNLMLLDLQTFAVKAVGKSGSRPDHYPNWSADGRRITFESYRRGGWHAWICDSDGQNASRLTNVPELRTSAYEFDPAFSPDNESVVFMQSDDLYVANISDKEPRRLSLPNSNLSASAPVFSPNGEKLALVGHSREDQSRDIYVMSMDGGDLHRLTENHGRNFAPQWSPNGQFILFYSDWSGSFELYEIGVENHVVHKIFDQKQLDSVGFTKTNFVNPWDNDWGAYEQYRASYSPDGLWIAFSREVDGDRELFISKRDGSTITRLTMRHGLDASPMWRPR